MKLFPNTIVRFHADYIDDDGKPAKERRHLVIKVNEKKKRLLLLKVTSQFKSLFYQQKTGLTECIDKISFVNLNGKIIFDLVSLEDNNYKKFQVCNLHSDVCLGTKRFEKIKDKLRKY
jgi:hypothetical protein